MLKENMIIDNKAESGGEAEATADAHYVEGDGKLLPFPYVILHKQA